MLTATRKDSAEISAILIQSFNDNKSLNYLIPKDFDRIKKQQCLIQYSILSCLEFGKVYLSKDKQACALILFPDCKRLTLAALWRNLKLVFTLGVSAAIVGMKRERLVKSRHPNGPLYYLWFVGVTPLDQGIGKGTSLMQELISDAHMMGREIVLETSTERNMPWYQKLGFQIYDELDLGYQLYFMKKQPSIILV